MKNKLIINVIAFICMLLAIVTGVKAQPQTVYVVPTVSSMKIYYGNASRLYVTEKNQDYVLCNPCTVDEVDVYAGVGIRKWKRIVDTTSSGGSSGDIVIGGPFTSVPIKGFNPGTNLSLPDFIKNTYYQSEVPTATLTGGTTLEFRSPQTMTYTLNYTAGRSASTEPISTIIVASNSKAFSQPSAGASVSGTQLVSFPANTNITYQNVVTTTDGKPAMASTTFTNSPKRYYGWITNITGIESPSFDDTKITSLSNEISFSKSKGGSPTWNTGNPTGSQYFVYAYYSTAGDLTQWDMNGFPSLTAMNKVTRSFTNALGFTGNWTIYWTKNAQDLSSSIIAN